MFVPPRKHYCCYPVMQYHNAPIMARRTLLKCNRVLHLLHKLTYILLVYLVCNQVARALNIRSKEKPEHIKHGNNPDIHFPCYSREYYFDPHEVTYYHEMFIKKH